METERKTMSNLESLAALELMDWSGLEGGITLDQARERFDVDDEFSGVRRLGSAGGEATWYSVPADGCPDGLRLWFRGPELIMADARRPRLPLDLEELLEALGAPQARLDA